MCNLRFKWGCHFIVNKIVQGAMSALIHIIKFSGSRSQRCTANFSQHVSLIQHVKSLSPKMLVMIDHFNWPKGSLCWIYQYFSAPRKRCSLILHAIYTKKYNSNSYLRHAKQIQSISLGSLLHINHNTMINNANSR